MAGTVQVSTSSVSLDIGHGAFIRLLVTCLLRISSGLRSLLFDMGHLHAATALLAGRPERLVVGGWGGCDPSDPETNQPGGGGRSQRSAVYMFTRFKLGAAPRDRD